MAAAGVARSGWLKSRNRLFTSSVTGALGLLTLAMSHFSVIFRENDNALEAREDLMQPENNLTCF